MSHRVMVSVRVAVLPEDGEDWHEVTRTLGRFTLADMRADWLAEFPRLLDRALAGTDDDEGDEPDDDGQMGIGL